MARLSRRDLVWRDNDVVWGARTECAPRRDDVATAVREFATENPRSPFLRLIDADRGTWRWPAPGELDRLATQIVDETTESADSAGLSSLAGELQRDPLGELPFRFTVGPDWAALHFNHALGDARTVWPLLMGLIAPARLAEFVPPPERVRLPIPVALWHTFGRHPGRLSTAVRGDRAPFPLSADGRLPFGAGSVNTVSRRSAAEFRKELVQHRKALAPSVSNVGFLAARAMGAISEAGLRPHSGLSVVADARRYLPQRKIGSGNFTAGAYLGVTDPHDATLISQTIDEYVTSARPLLTLTLMAARARRGARTEPRWVESAQSARCLVSFSYVGRLPWPGAPPLGGHVAGKPLGHHGIAIVVLEIGSYFYASVSHDPNYVTVDTAAAVAHALTSFE